MKPQPRYYEKIKVAHKQIRLRKQNQAAAKEIAKEVSKSALCARVLAARGFEADDQLRKFLNPTLKDGLPDPAKLKNLSKAAKLVAQMISEDKAIAICCDFDV